MSNTKRNQADLITHMDGDAFVITLRTVMPAETVEDFVSALHAGDASAVLTWTPTTCGATLITGTGDDRREVCAFSGGITSR